MERKARRDALKLRNEQRTAAKAAISAEARKSTAPTGGMVLYYDAMEQRVKDGLMDPATLREAMLVELARLKRQAANKEAREMTEAAAAMEIAGGCDLEADDMME
jgi:hypothetical protein